MQTTLRHWHLLRTLPRYPRKADSRAATASLRRRGFDVTKRTVERDLQSLSRVFPLHCDDRSQPYGWSWARDGQAFDIPGMDAETALSFTVLDRFARHLLPGNVIDRIGPQVARARSVLAELSAGQGPRVWPDRVRVLSRGFALQAPAIDPGVADVAYQSLLERRCFRGVYHSRAAATAGGREYEVHPLGLVFRDQVAYLVATLEDYSDVRQLALHRFSEAGLLDRQRREPADFDLDVYIAQGHFHIREGEEDLRVHLQFTADAAYHLGETPLSDDQELRAGDDGRIAVRATVRDTAQFRWWLLGFGDAVEVLRPVALRRQIADVLRCALDRYDH